MRSSETNRRATTAGYAELALRMNRIFLDNMAAANQRSLDYWKTVWGVVARPYPSTAVDACARENLERATQVAGLTAAELQAAAHRNAELAEKLFGVAADLADSYAHSLRGLMRTGVSNANFVREAAELQFVDFAKRLDRM